MTKLSNKKTVLRKQLAVATEEFLAKGGKVQVIPQGKRGEV